MEEVREKRGLAYSVYSYLNPMDHSAIFMGSVATKNEAIAQSLDVIRDQLKEMAETGPSPEDLKAAQDYLTGSYALRFDSNEKIASQLLGIMIEDMGIDYVNKRNELVNAVTLEDIKRAAKRFLDPSDLLVTVVGKPTGLAPKG
jgi:zinc protease